MVALTACDHRFHEACVGGLATMAAYAFAVCPVCLAVSGTFAGAQPNRGKLKARVCFRLSPVVGHCLKV